jgi:hypothetical protein
MPLAPLMMATAADALTRFVGRLHTGAGTSSCTPSRSTADAPPPTVPGDEPHLGCSHWLQPYYTSAPLYLLLDTFTLHRNRTAAGRTPRSWSPSRTGSAPVHLQVPLQVSRCLVPTPAVTWYYYNDLTVRLVTTVHRRAAGTCSWTPSPSTATAPPPPVQYTTAAPLAPALGHLHAPQPHRRRPYRETSLTLAALSGHNRTLRAGTWTLATSRSWPDAPPPTVPRVGLTWATLTLPHSAALVQPTWTTCSSTATAPPPPDTRAMTSRDSSCRWPRAWIPDTSVLAVPTPLREGDPHLRPTATIHWRSTNGVSAREISPNSEGLDCPPDRC